MTLLGLIGGPLILASGIAVLLGVWEQVSTWSAIATIPEFAWEVSLGIYLIIKGFTGSPGSRRHAPPPTLTPAHGPQSARTSACSDGSAWGVCVPATEWVFTTRTGSPRRS